MTTDSGPREEVNDNRENGITTYHDVARDEQRHEARQEIDLSRGYAEDAIATPRYTWWQRFYPILFEDASPPTTSATSFFLQGAGSPSTSGSFAKVRNDESATEVRRTRRRTKESEE